MSDKGPATYTNSHSNSILIWLPSTETMFNVMAAKVSKRDPSLLKIKRKHFTGHPTAFEMLNEVIRKDSMSDPSVLHVILRTSTDHEVHDRVFIFGWTCFSYSPFSIKNRNHQEATETITITSGLKDIVNLPRSQIDALLSISAKKNQSHTSD